MAELIPSDYKVSVNLSPTAMIFIAAVVAVLVFKK